MNIHTFVSSVISKLLYLTAQNLEKACGKIIAKKFFQGSIVQLKTGHLSFGGKKLSHLNNRLLMLCSP